MKTYDLKKKSFKTPNIIISFIAISNNNFFLNLIFLNHP